MTDIYSKKKRSEIMSRVRNTRTAPENIVASMLKKICTKYRRNVGSLPGQPDFVIPSACAVLFVHGCFWHNHPNCARARLPTTNIRFWQRKIAANKRRDHLAAYQLRRQGWHVITIWQCKLRHPWRVLRRLERLLRNTRPGIMKIR